MRVAICVAAHAPVEPCAGRRAKMAIGKGVGNSPPDWLGQTMERGGGRTCRMATSAMVLNETDMAIFGRDVVGVWFCRLMNEDVYFTQQLQILMLL